MPSITKDEAVVIASVINDSWHWYIRDTRSRDESIKIAVYLQNLAKRLEEAGQDKRRQGRTSINDFQDILKRAMKSEVKDA